MEQCSYFMMRFFILFSLLCFGITNAAGQNTSTRYSSWNTFDVSKQINQNWSINTEFNLRRTQFLKDWEQLVIRPFVHYKFENDLDIAFGYSYIRNYKHDGNSLPLDIIEHNIFQQLTLTHRFSNFILDHRLRFEVRHIDYITELFDGVYDVDGSRIRNRFRYKFQIRIPLKTFNESQAISAILYDEAFLDLGNGLRPEKLDQNWMFVGLIFRVSKQVKVRSGYHDIYAKREDLFINNRVWETTLTYTF